MPKDDLTVVAFISIKLHDNGAMSVEGNIGDAPFAIRMLDAAKDAVRNQQKPKELIVIPNRDVDAQQSPAFPSLARGDMRPEDRGDPP